MRIPTVEDVKEAAIRISGEAFRTPLLQNATLNKVSGATVYLKPECLQRTGSFKFRGAYNAISLLNDEEKSKGVVASSSGNHAQGVAEASAIFGIDATIVMPSDAPEIKVRRTKASGATVVFYDRESEDREAVLETYRQENDLVLVHPFNNPNVIAGQGTVGLETAEDLVTKGIALDHVLVCTGGGGLTAGVCLGIRSAFDDAQIHTVEPEKFDDYKRSLASGKIEQNPQTSGSICDAILTPSPGEIAFEIGRANLSDGLTISDGDAKHAMRFAYEHLKLVVEPGGAAALAALLKYSDRWAGKSVAVVISGGNVDPQMFCDVISA
ncbi:MAG: threonine ammonia-lyase [Rhizobiaceae bacterium]